MSNLAYDIRLLRRELGKDSLLVFSKMYFKKYFKFPEAKFHREIYKLLQDVTAQRSKRTAIASPRGSAKSSIVSLFFVIWCICYNKESYIILLSDTSSQAQEMLANIKNELTANTLLMEDFPEVCTENQALPSFCWKKNEIITKNNIKVRALGANQKMRGRRYKENRPSLIILDDIENDQNTQSQEQREKLFDWFTGAILKVGDVGTNVICVGTIQHYDSLLAKLMHKHKMPEWDKIMYKSVIEWSKKKIYWQLWANTYNYRNPNKPKQGPDAAKEYFLKYKETMLKGTEVLWPEKEDYYMLMEMRESEGSYSFDTEKQNEPINSRTMIFNPYEFQYWDDRCELEEDLIIKDEDFDIYGGCDPSLGKSSTSDYSAIVTLARHKETGNCYLLDAYIIRCKPDQLIENILAYCAKRKYKKFAIEANQFQAYLAQEIIKKINAQGLYVPIKTVTNSKDKVSRIKSLQPFVAHGTIRFSRKHNTLIEQLKHFPMGAHDDGPDALEMAFQICQEDTTQQGWYPLYSDDYYD